MDKDNTCTLCNSIILNDEEVSVVQSKGLKTFIHKSKLREDGKWKIWEHKDSIPFHSTCRKKYSSLSDKAPKKRKLSSSTNGKNAVSSLCTQKTSISPDHSGVVDNSSTNFILSPPSNPDSVVSDLSRKRSSISPDRSHKRLKLSDHIEPEVVASTSRVQNSSANFILSPSSNPDSVVSDLSRKRSSVSPDRSPKRVKLSDHIEPEVVASTSTRENSSRNCISNNSINISSSTDETATNADDGSYFDFKNLCVVCGKPLDRNHKEVRKLTNVVSENFLKYAESQGDELKKELKSRLDLWNSGTNQEGYYHEKCRSSSYIKPSKKLHNVRNPYDLSFDKVKNYIKHSGNFRFNLSDLQKKMGETVLSNYMLKKKLKDEFGDDIFIVELNGKSPIFIYKSFNLPQHWIHDPNSLSDLEKRSILEISAEILSYEIKNGKYDVENYPPPSQFLDTVALDIPKGLKVFLNRLLFNEDVERYGEKKIKRDSIAHSIMSILRPKLFISKLQLSVGTYIYRKTGSRLVIDLLNKLGVSASYHNIQLYEASTILHPPKVKYVQGEYRPLVQFVFDNTDHNVSTIDGRETFHCLGGIAVYTPHYGIKYEGGSKKCTEMPTASMLATQKQIPIVPFDCSNPKGLEDVIFLNTSKMHIARQSQLLEPPYVAYLLAKRFKVEKIPSWKGFFEAISYDEGYNMCHVTCLPFINGPPSHETTLNSALLYAISLTKAIGQKFTIVTFDQPLYHKVRCMIAQSNNPLFKNIIVRLGGFHLLMSYFGAIGTIMEGSGLHELWSVIYASESVKKMLTGHAFSRALRAHILTFTALSIIICKNFSDSESIKKYIDKFLSKWSETPPTIGECNDDPLIGLATKEFIAELDKLEKNGPTPKLWIQYMKAVIIGLQFVESERLGLWNLSLQSMENMLPIFPAAGHFAYAKDLQICLQDLATLDRRMPLEEYRMFAEEGGFTMRRSDKAWAGVWSDMTIEMTLNRFFGTDLRHGRGVTPSVVARYLLGMPSAFDVMQCLEDYVDLQTSNSEQHVDLGSSRMKRDDADIEKLLFWLEQHRLFDQTDKLMSLSTGIVGGTSINCHQAFELGRKGLQSMVDKSLANVSLSKIYKVKSLSTADQGMHVNVQDYKIDTNLLFNKIFGLFNGNEMKTRNALNYELSPYPQTLFDDKGLMRKTQKAELFKIFETHICSAELLNSFLYVIDGGWLLHKIIWPHSKKYIEIFEIYRQYISQNFGQSSRIIFDGYSYENIGTKSYERYRRKESNIGPDVEINEENLVTLTQKKFLDNTANKLQFVNLLSAYLNKHGLETIIAEEDADVMIIDKALEIKKNSNQQVAVVGNDTDLMVLLIAKTPDHENIFFRKVLSSKKDEQLFASSRHRALKPIILFAHAFVGCDTTSAFFNLDKKSIITLLLKNKHLSESIQIFYKENMTIDQLYPHSENLVKHLYDAKSTQLSISELRYKIYMDLQAQATKHQVLPLLPPTESALIEHTKRVYYQILAWLGHIIQPLDWGWVSFNNILFPTMSMSLPAPQELLQSISCGCKGNCKSRCGCKKAGVRCSRVCKNCRGENCDNRSLTTETVVNSDDAGKEISEFNDEDEHGSYTSETSAENVFTEYQGVDEYEFDDFQ